MNGKQNNRRVKADVELIDVSFREGVAAGMDNAGQMILDALNESPVDMIKRICREKLIKEKE